MCCSNCPRRNRSDQRNRAACAAAGSSVLPEDVRTLQQHGRHTDARSLLSVGRERSVAARNTDRNEPFQRVRLREQTHAVPEQQGQRNLIVIKIDHTINANNSTWYRFQQDTGLQAAYTDQSTQSSTHIRRSRSGRLLSATRTCFTPNLVNQFNPGASWYSSLFLPNNYPQVLQTCPIVLVGGSSNAPFTTLGGNNQTYTQGRKVTRGRSTTTSSGHIDDIVSSSARTPADWT